jgi:hypothetical protein
MAGDIGRTMLSGFNTNFRYRGVLFHVQTEDSGRANPHVITHLFHGGNIMASHKRDYSMLLEDEGVDDAVRKLMETQHKTMLKQLSRGEHDAVIGQRLGKDVFRVAPNVEATPSSVTEGAPPTVVAEHAEIGVAGALSNSSSGDSILEPEFAPDVTPIESDTTDADDPATRDFDESSADAVEPPAPSATPKTERPKPRKSTQLSRVFGDRIVSEKPLDEVVLDYLVDNARKRKRQPK